MVNGQAQGNAKRVGGLELAEHVFGPARFSVRVSTPANNPITRGTGASAYTCSQSGSARSHSPSGACRPARLNSASTMDGLSSSVPRYPSTASSSRPAAARYDARLMWRRILSGSSRSPNCGLWHTRRDMVRVDRGGVSAHVVPACSLATVRRHSAILDPAAAIHQSRSSPDSLRPVGLELNMPKRAKAIRAARDDDPRSCPTKRVDHVVAR